MKLRVIQQNRAIIILCPNGSYMEANKESLGKLLVGFKKPTSFKGQSGYWNKEITCMDDVPGITLAFVDDANKLVILSEKLFAPEKQIVYISATEYAKMHGKCRATIKNLCVAGKIPGAYKNSSGWQIPKDAPYPVGKDKETK